MKLIDNSYNYREYPQVEDVYSLLLKITETVKNAADENDWFENINNVINNWLI
jgi:hypothetical protein